MSDRPVPENPYAAQGPVLIDIGEDVGALVVTCPVHLVGQEIGIRALAAGTRLDHLRHTHSAGGHHAHPPGAAPGPAHVGVHARPLPSGGLRPSAVYPDLPAGDYEIWVLPSGEPRRVHVGAGVVTDVQWEEA